MTRSRPYLRLLSALCFILLLPAGPGLLEAGQKDKCEGTKKQRKQKMDLREVTSEKLAALVEGYKLTVSAEREQIADTVLRRLEREYLESTTTGEPFVFDVLILSGGGAKGAFGAGFLEGWTSITSGPGVRPEFDVVTGVSTGALIGPFAFTGTNTALAQVGDFYSNPEPNWVRERGKFSTLPHHASLFNTCHLQEVIREKVDEELVRSLAVGAAENRLLLVGATNLDAGRGRRFDLTHEAQIALESGSFDRIHDILLASTAIPGVFPPVEIDKMYYADGGATSNLFLMTFSSSDGPLARFRSRHPEAVAPQLRIWVVVNQRLVPDSAVTQPRWLSVSARALSTLTSTSQIFALGLIKAFVYESKTDRGVDAEVRLVSIPLDAPRPASDEMFEKEYMNQLRELGQAMGADPGSWRTELPSPYALDRD